MDTLLTIAQNAGIAATVAVVYAAFSISATLVIGRAIRFGME